MSVFPRQRRYNRCGTLFAATYVAGLVTTISIFGNLPPACLFAVTIAVLPTLFAKRSACRIRG